MTCFIRTAGKILNALEPDIASYSHGEVVHRDFVEVKDGESASSQIKARREALCLGLTLKEVADRADIVLQQYQKYEGGQRDLRNGTFQSACRVIERWRWTLQNSSGGLSHL